MSKSLRLVILLAFSFLGARAQYTVKVVIDSMPTTHPSDTLFLSGDYNGWSPNDFNSMFVKDPNTGKPLMMADNVPANSYSVKVTRGTAASIECTADGKPIPPRTVTISSDTTLHITVAGWSDDFPKNGTTGAAPVGGAPETVAAVWTNPVTSPKVSASQKGR